MLAPALDALFAGIVFLGLSLPPGFLFLRALRIQGPPLTRLALALALGLVIVLCALVLELLAGGPWLILPLSVGCLLLLKPDRGLGPPLRSMGPEIVASLLLGSVALVANGSDVFLDEGGLSVRMGFDVSDRAFYGTVSQELERAPLWRLENPAFAPAPLQYSYLPALAGVLVRRYAGVDPLVSFGTSLPAFGIFFTGLAVAALAQSFGAGRLGRLLCMVLVILGGDVSFLVPDIAPNWLERARHFFVFYSFGAEASIYNPWMFGMPLALTTLLGLKLLLDGTGRELVGPVALLLAALFQTKVFAFIPIWLAVALFALVARHLRLGAVALLALVLSLPSLLLVAASEGVRGGPPLGFEPLALIRDAVSMHPSLTRLAALAGFPVAALLIVLGGTGLRVFGLPELYGRMRRDDGAAARLCALVVGFGLVLSCCLVGRPTRLEPVQFMFLPHAVLWVFFGLALARGFHAPASRVVIILVLALSVVTPIRYIALKAAPDYLATSPLDRMRFVLPATTVEASLWLRFHSPAADRLVLPLSGDPEDRGGLKPLYVGLLASRRLVGESALYHVGEGLALERQSMILRLYATTDPSEGERLLSQLKVDWVWEDIGRRLQFQSPRLVPQAMFGRTRLLRVAARD
jgi:hypothetical protein